MSEQSPICSLFSGLPNRKAGGMAVCHNGLDGCLLHVAIADSGHCGHSCVCKNH